MGFEKQAQGAGALLLTAYPSVYKTVEIGRPRLALTILPEGLVNFGGFILPWYLVSLSGTLATVGIYELYSVIVGFMSGIISAGVSGTLPALLIGRIILSYLLGYWIGIRCDRFGGLVSAMITLPVSIVAAAVDIIATSDDTFRQFYGEDKSLAIFARIAVMGSLIFAPFILFGFWRGRRAQLTAYLRHLLRRLPSDTRKSIVDLVYEEARRVTPDPNRPAAAEVRT